MVSRVVLWLLRHLKVSKRATRRRNKQRRTGGTRNVSRLLSSLHLSPQSLNRQLMRVSKRKMTKSRRQRLWMMLKKSHLMNMKTLLSQSVTSSLPESTHSSRQAQTIPQLERLLCLTKRSGKNNARLRKLFRPSTITQSRRRRQRRGQSR